MYCRSIYFFKTKKINGYFKAKKDSAYRRFYSKPRRHAVSRVRITGEFPVLAGEVGIAYSTDLLAPAREVFDFSKTHKENCAIVGGIFEGVYKDQAAMLSLATIPSREVLLSQIAFLLKSPLQRLAIAVNEVAKTKS